LPRSTEPETREWEKWLKGAQPTVPVTFDQGIAVENAKALHLSVSHPLVRQAAQHLKLDESAYAVLESQSAVVAPGEYRFGIYRWTKQGVKQEEMLIPVVSDIAVEETLFSLLQTATTREDSDLPDNPEFDALDVQHHRKWAAAQANHIAENRQQVEYQIQSLTISHKARCKAIEHQLNQTANDKIRLMKQSELGRVNLDFVRRMAELEQAAESGDIHAMSILFGTILIKG
jgi:ATP-dependent helicase HepA